MKLIIVESYQKTKVLKKYFKNDTIVSCNGHMIDLDPKTLSIEKKQNQYIPKYKFLNQYKYNFIQNLKKQKNKYDEIILASDFDNEGEFIAQTLKKYLQLTNYNRIIFHSLSKKDLENAIAQKTKINNYIVHSQQTRRMIDRLIGYKIQKVLGKQFSIGRNQAIVLQFIKTKCENYEKKKTVYEITLINDRDDTKIIEMEYKPTSKTVAVLKKYTEVEYIFPHPLLSTSAIQILAYQKHKIDPFLCTKILNELYNSGIITYIRTDAEVVNPTFIENCVSKIQLEINFTNIKKLKSKFKSSTKPHEAIRPVSYTIPKTLSGNHKKVFDLIYFTTIENFLHPMTIHSTYADIKIENTIKKIKIHEKIVNQGFNELRKQKKVIPHFLLNKLKILKSQKKEKRLDSLYTKTNLIKEMKTKKIATPSTYDYSIKQLLQKKYITSTSSIYITKKGLFLLQFISKYFPKFTKITFIQNMYKNIDLIQNKQIDLNSVVSEVDKYINSQLKKIPVNYNLTTKWINTTNV